MTELKPCFTPIATKPPLVKNHGDAITQAEDYKRIVGALQYITITQPDIAFSVNKLCQFMNCPNESH